MGSSASCEHVVHSDGLTSVGGVPSDGDSSGSGSMSTRERATNGSALNPACRIRSSSPSDLKISIDRVLTAIARGKIVVPGCRSTVSDGMPQRESRIEVVRPVGPAPTTSTGTSTTAASSAARSALTIARLLVPRRDVRSTSLTVGTRSAGRIRGTADSLLSAVLSPHGELGAVGQAGLHERAAHVALDGPHRQVQACGDLAVGESLSDQSTDLELTNAHAVSGDAWRSGVAECERDGVVDTEAGAVGPGSPGRIAGGCLRSESNAFCALLEEGREGCTCAIADRTGRGNDSHGTRCVDGDEHPRLPDQRRGQQGPASESAQPARRFAKVGRGLLGCVLRLGDDAEVDVTMAE